jgi:hypothetical protein
LLGICVFTGIRLTDLSREGDLGREPSYAAEGASSPSSPSNFGFLSPVFRFMAMYAMASLGLEIS